MGIGILASEKPLGADVVGVDLSRPIDDETADALRRAVLDHLVLRVRDQRLSDAALVEVARIFGAPELSPRSEVSDKVGEYAPSMPEVTIISNIEVDGQAIGSLGAGEAAWEQVWRVGDMIIWDNRAVMHRRDPFESTARRLLHRTQVKGGQPAS